MSQVHDALKKAIELSEQMTEVLRKSQMSLDFSAPAHDHHVAYTRTSASGTVSNIQSKGSPKVEIKRVSTDHANVSQRNVTFDLYKDGKYHSTHPDADAAMTHKEAIEKEGAASVKPTLPAHWKDAHDHAENTSEAAWNGQGPSHKDAEEALRHSANLHRSASAAAMADGDTGAAKHHDMKAHYHETAAEQHAARAHADWANEQQAKQVAKVNAGFSAERAKSEAMAGAHLTRVANANNHLMVRKAEEWKETNDGIPGSRTQRHEVDAKHIEGTEAKHHGMDEVYNQGQRKPYTEFSKEFHEKNQGNPFVLKHSNGNKYLIDPQGYNYARYISRIKE